MHMGGTHFMMNLLLYNRVNVPMIRFCFVLLFFFFQFITQSNGFPLEAEQKALAGRILSHISVHHFSALFNRIVIR